LSFKENKLRLTMKIKAFIILLVFLFVGSLFAVDVLEFFNGYSSGKSIIIEWKSSDEKTVNKYEIERNTPNQSFKMIHSEAAKGFSTNYKYIDDEAYSRKNGDVILSQTTYCYRIKIVYNDNSYIYSNSVNVTQDVSIIRRTWGMIKEMFR
jgi:hypothetical protein